MTGCGAVRGERLFRFAVIADSHVEPPGDPEPRSNSRLARAVSALGRLEPAFVLHLGDLIHPLPATEDEAPALAEAKRLLDGLNAPIHVTPGNHDIGDKPNPLMPAASVSSQWRADFARNWGNLRHCFDHAECRFVLVDSPSLNDDIKLDEDVLSWLSDTMAGADKRRIFLATHYPLFLHRPDEPAHYDNIDEPMRGRLLELLRRHFVEAVFTGHIHNIFWHRVGDMQCHGVASLAFVRRDYAELFRLGPLAEDGREDPSKIGFLLVDVHEHGHVARWLRLGDYEGDTLSVPGHVGTDPPAPFGVDLRHPWTETVTFPFNPPTEAFSRKTFRNDYPVQALIEMGVSDLRVPVDDLLDHSTRARMMDLAEIGMRWTVFTTTLGVPDIAHQLPPGITAFELIGPKDELLAHTPELMKLRQSSNMALLFNELRPASSGDPSSRFGKHRIDLGHAPEDLAAARSFLMELENVPQPFGIVFRAPVENIDTIMLDRLEAFAEEHGACLALHATWAQPDMGDRAASDTPLLAMIERLLDRPRQAKHVTIFLDTFMTIDRGYHVRTGLIDRRANFTAAGLALRDACTSRKVSLG